MNTTTSTTLLCGILSIAGQTITQADNGIWALPGDLLGAPNQLSFNQGAKGVWYFLESRSLEHDPLTYHFLPNYSASCIVPGQQGLACWSDTPDPANPLSAFPHVGLNFNDQTVYDRTRGDWSSHVLLMHPHVSRPAIIAWRSPRTVKVALQGSFNSLYTCNGVTSCGCGDGVKWTVEQGMTVLASGDLALNAGTFDLTQVELNEGEAIYFIADPKLSDACDSTQVSITITESHSKRKNRHFGK